MNKEQVLEIVGEIARDHTSDPALFDKLSAAIDVLIESEVTRCAGICEQVAKLVTENVPAEQGMESLEGIALTCGTFIRASNPAVPLTQI